MLQVSVFRGAGSAAPCVGKKERNIPAGVIQRSRPSRPPGMSLTAPRESHLAAHLSFSVRFRSSSVQFSSVQRAECARGGFSAPSVSQSGLVCWWQPVLPASHDAARLTGSDRRCSSEPHCHAESQHACAIAFTDFPLHGAGHDCASISRWSNARQSGMRASSSALARYTSWV